MLENRAGEGSRRSEGGLGFRAQPEREGVPAEADKALAPAALGSRTNWRTGRASKNSLAITMAGPSGTSSIRSRHAIRRTEARKRRRCRSRRTGLVSTRCDVEGVEEIRRERGRPAGRRPSGCRVRVRAPRAGRGRAAHRVPDLDIPQADQLAEHLADLGRGDEVAGRAERVAGRVVACSDGRHSAM